MGYQQTSLQVISLKQNQNQLQNMNKFDNNV